MGKITHNIYQVTVLSARCFFPLGNRFNQHMKFTFFHFNKKIKTCFLLSSLTLKVSNEISSNFDNCRLKDCTLWEKYENVICGIISVSSYGPIELPSMIVLRSQKIMYLLTFEKLRRMAKIPFLLNKIIQPDSNLALLLDKLAQQKKK